MWNEPCKKNIMRSHPGSFPTFPQELHLSSSPCPGPLLELCCGHVYTWPCTFLIWTLMSWPQTCLIIMDLSGVVNSLLNQISATRRSLLFLLGYYMTTLLASEPGAVPASLVAALNSPSHAGAALFLGLSEIYGEDLHL